MKLPLVFTATPMSKWILCCNPFTSRLEEVYANQWTQDLPVSAVELYKGLLQSISWSLHTERDRADIDEDRFAAHYPIPPPNRKDRTVVGLQFSTLVLLTNTKHAIEDDEKRRDADAIHGVFEVPLSEFIAHSAEKPPVPCVAARTSPLTASHAPLSRSSRAKISFFPSICGQVTWK